MIRFKLTPFFCLFLFLFFFFFWRKGFFRIALLQFLEKVTKVDFNFLSLRFLLCVKYVLKIDPFLNTVVEKNRTNLRAFSLGFLLFVDIYFRVVMLPNDRGLVTNLKVILQKL